MSDYNFSFDSEESKEIFKQTVVASKQYEDACDEIIKGFASLAKFPMEDIDSYAGKDGIVLYWKDEELVHVKTCADNKMLKMAGMDSFSYEEVNEEFLVDLLNTINLTVKPKFVIDLKGKDKEVFLHIQKLELVAEGLDIPDEEALDFCEDMDITIYETGSGVKYVNLGKFVEKLMECAN